MFKVISDKMAHWYEMIIAIIFTINFSNTMKLNCAFMIFISRYCTGMKMICALMFVISNHYGINCLSNLLQFEPCDGMFQVISEIMAHW